MSSPVSTEKAKSEADQELETDMKKEEGKSQPMDEDATVEGATSREHDLEDLDMGDLSIEEDAPEEHDPAHVGCAVPCIPTLDAFVNVDSLLCVREPWCSLLASGKKCWEIRSSPIAKRSWVWSLAILLLRGQTQHS